MEKALDAGEGTVMLVVFRLSLSLKSSLENILARTEWGQANLDRFCLFVVTSDYSSRGLDGAIWAVNIVFGLVELVRYANHLYGFDFLTSFRIYSHQ